MTAVIDRRPAARSPVTANRRGHLALALQEAFTAAVRLRSNRQVAADAGAFRSQIKQVLATADQQARRAGYAGEDVKLAIYAFIVFLDESVLGSSQPMFVDWPRKPLQEEIFGGHMGGEIFFKNLQALLGRPESEDLADLLEVYQLCMLLGFRGRYSSGNRGELHASISATADKIARIRGGRGELSPSWAPPAHERVPVVKDPWIRRLGYVAFTVLALAVLLFVVYSVALRTGGPDAM